MQANTSASPHPSDMIRPDHFYTPCAPFTQTENGPTTTWLTRPSDVAAATSLERSGKLSQALIDVLKFLRSQGMPVPAMNEVHLGFQFLWAQKGPRYDRLGGLLSGYFHSSQTERPATSVLEYLPGALEKAKRQAPGSIDITQLAGQVSSHVIQQILGLNAQGAMDLEGHVQEYAQRDFMAALQTEPQEVRDFLQRVVEVNRDQKLGGLIAHLQEAVEKLIITARERDALIWGTWAAGHRTTAEGITLLLGLLAEFGYMEEAYASLHTPDGAAWRMNAVKEALRYLAPFPYTLMVCHEEVSLSDQFTIPPGLVNVVWSAASRKEADTFNPNQPVTQHFAFGHGLHYCLGASLATQVMANFLQAVLKDCPGLELREWAWATPGLTNGVERAVFDYGA